MAARIEEEIERAAFLGQRLEDLVYNKVKDGGITVRGNNDDLLIAYWSLIFDYSKGMLCLLQYKFHSPAFALARPMIEALAKAQLVLFTSDDEVTRIRQDRYRVSYEKDGQRIDEYLDSSPLFENLLKGSRDLLHSLTHSGKAQLWRRFDGDQVGSGYTDGEIWGLLGTACSAMFMITALITDYYGMEQQFQQAQASWAEFGRERDAVRAFFSVSDCKE